MKKYASLLVLLLLLCCLLFACTPEDASTPETTAASATVETTVDSADSTDVGTDALTEPPTEQTTEEPAETPAEESTEIPTEEPTEAPAEPETEPDVAGITARPPEVLRDLSDSFSAMDISTVCRQVTLTDVDLETAKQAFLSEGYLLVPSTAAYGTKLQTAVLKGSHFYVTLMQTSEGLLHVLWENTSAVSVTPLLQNGRSSQTEVTMAQIGIARETEDDNPMIGMCYVYRLDDGTALIIDGGVNNESCAKNLYRTLEQMDVAKDENGKYRITAWVFTHGHGDHYGTFKQFASLYADKTDLAYTLYSFPVNDLAPGGCNADSFANVIQKAYPNASRISPHAGLQYHFANLTLHVLYAPELLYTTKTVDYYNNTSLILCMEAGGQSILHMGDAGEMASEAAWNQNNTEAFASTALQITHHGLYTGADGGHSWNYMRKIYQSTNATIGLLPMGTRKPGDARNGRHTVLVGWGMAGHQVSFVINKKDNRNGASTEQAYFDKFVSGVAAGTADRETLFGYNGINLVTSHNGLITYINASETEPMATVFTLSPDGLTLVANETLAAWLEK